MYSLEAIEIIVSGTNRFNEAQKGVFVCAFRGCNYELDGIRVERSGRKYSNKKSYQMIQDITFHTLTVILKHVKTSPSLFDCILAVWL